MLRRLNMKWVISVNNLDCLLLLHLGKIRKSLIKFSERNLLHITIVIRKENSISLQNYFSKKPKTKDSKFEKYFSKGKCFNCGESRHFAYKCPKPPKKIKQEINASNIEESENENIFRILQNNDFSDFSSEEDFLTFDDSDYHSASEFSEDVKIGCFYSCCSKKKTCSVLTKAKEQEDLLITLFSKIENPELKEEYLKKL
jgi:hypothetical protein